jgi:PAS domain S-box-containing protein
VEGGQERGIEDGVLRRFPRGWNMMDHLRQVAVLRRALVWVTVAAAYAAAGAIADRWGSVSDGVPLILPAAGVAFTAIQLGGVWTTTALFVGGLADGLRRGLPLSASLLLGAAAAGTGIAAWAAARALRLRPRGERLRDTFRRVTAGGAAALVGATGTAAALRAAGRPDVTAELWGTLLLGGLAGILIVSPFIRAWTQRGSRGVARLPELVAVLVVPGAIAAFVVSGSVGSAGPTAYLIFPIVLWAALRTGRMGVSGVLLVTALLAVETASNGRGPFYDVSVVATAAKLGSFIVVLALTGLLLAGLDLERRVTATGLSEAEERHRRLIERLPLVTYVRSLRAPDAPPDTISPQVVDLLGYPVETWLALPYLGETIVHPEDRGVHAELNARGMTDDIVQGEYRMIAADGRVVWILDHMIAVRDDNGKVVAQQGFVIDVTARKQLEEQLVRAQRLEALGLLAGGVAHDFNNLLTAISGYTQLAAGQVGKADELARRHLGEVQVAAERAAELTRRLLAFGSRQVLDRAVVDLNEVVVEAQHLLVPVIGQHIVLVTDLDPLLPAVQADRVQLGQVLVNLAVNARDAMPGGGTLTIRTHTDGADVVLTVADTGVGMDAATRARIFEPFFTTKPVGEGTGLGLAMVYGIVQQSEGQLAVESEPGRGTTFQLTLPVTDAVPEAGVVDPAAAAAAAEEDGGGSETVLLVEDEDVVRRLTAEMLERHGYRVVAAAGPEEALQVDEPWDLLLTDVVMPGMNGPELARRLVERHPQAGVLFTSGYSGAAVADRAALGADLLEKPFTLDELARKVRAALDARPS